MRLSLIANHNKKKLEDAFYNELMKSNSYLRAFKREVVRATGKT